MAQKVRFTKMHGCGNDYIYVNTMQQNVPNPSEAAVAWSHRHKGIGSDGLVLIGASPVPEADFSMRIFNADGSEAMMCGNASRCIGKYLYERGLTDKKEIRLLTLSGVKILELSLTPSSGLTPNPSPKGEGNFKGEGSEYRQTVESVTVDMGEPILDDPVLFIPTRGLNKGTFVSMGNPHYVIFTDNVDMVVEKGSALEHHPSFPQRCNIEFAAPLLSPQPGGSSGAVSSPAGEGQEGTFRVRVWERGSGITQACGTGACATAVAAALTGKSGRKSQIMMDGGTLSIEWRESNNHVYMTGPATFVFDGEFEIP